MSSIPATSGIYRITCTETHRIYIGSAVDMRRRCRQHLHGLRNNVHHSITLQRAFNKYGESAFMFDAIELVLPPFLIEREQYWLDRLQPYNPKKGYNIDRIAGSRMGHEVAPKTREKLRRANLGKKHNEQTLRKMSKSRTGKTQSAKTREKLSTLNMGHPVSEEAREHMRDAQFGKKQSEATKEKRRQSRLGYTYSDASRAKISAGNAAHPTHIKRMKTIVATAPDGTVYTVTGIGKFCREHDLNHSALIQVAKGKATHHKGWKAFYL